MKHETFSRARLEILNYVIAFCTNTLYDGKYFPPFSEGSGFESVKIGGAPPIGSLVRLMAAPATKWYLSWVVDVKKEEDGKYTKCLLKSIEDGVVCTPQEFWQWRTDSVWNNGYKLFEE